MMKTRICYLYENGNPSMLAAFLEADSMADMINRVEYARQVSEYDQRMMQKLRKIWIRQLKQHTEFGPSMVLQGDWQVLYLEN